ncbi:MAG: biopolymer transporter Tol [Gammaproteobacteria bacterium]|nr:PD40 domain-containing protein [Pseudomonadales bacterium]MCP5348179.1 PD40 domain-containing protein [Pseudomonadales bacterium]
MTLHLKRIFPLLVATPLLLAGCDNDPAVTQAAAPAGSGDGYSGATAAAAPEPVATDGAAGATSYSEAPTATGNMDENESLLLANTRRLVTTGARSGEGYFSADGERFIFQSEVEGDNPFYQIFLMDLETGDTNRVSPGIGLTTCSWIHPTLDRVIFASTHGDPLARQKQADEIAFRNSGQQRAYAWDYDQYYDIYQANPDGSELENLTNTPGYDAEGSYSPDGSRILFASNREAYQRTLSLAEQKLFEDDSSYFMDLYMMDADGSNVQQLTFSPGYDGGPFFSADGEKIVWRRFNPDGNSAEIWTMDVDGSNQRQLTAEAMVSWGPYFHPSGDYIIYSSNVLGHANFELFLIDRDGLKEPVRVTNTAGTDILPVFSPDGSQMAWSTTRTEDGSSQIYIADWNDAAARQLLGLD